MPISFVGSLPPVGANNGGNVTLTFSNLRDAANAAVSLQQNDLVVVAYACSGTADHAMSTSSSLWNEVNPEVYANNAIDTNLAAYWKVMGATPDTSFVAVGPGGASNGTIGVAMVFRGVDTTTPLDVAATTASALASALNPSSIAPSSPGAWPVIIGAGAAGAGAAFTHSDLSSTTNHFRSANHAETNDIAIGMGIKTDWVSGAFDPAAWGGFAAPASWTAISLALREQVPAVDPGDAAHAHSSTSPAIGAFSSVSAADALHGHAATSPAIAANSTVVPANALHGHTATSPSISAGNLAVDPDDALHAQSAGSPAIAALSTVTPANTAHGHSASEPTVVPHYVFSPADCLHGHTASQPIVNYIPVIPISPNNSRHMHFAWGPGQTIPTPARVTVICFQ